MQDAFVRGMEKVQTVESEESAVALMQRNATIDHYRSKASATRALESFAAELDPAAPTGDEERQERLSVQGTACGCQTAAAHPCRCKDACRCTQYCSCGGGCNCATDPISGSTWRHQPYPWNFSSPSGYRPRGTSRTRPTSFAEGHFSQKLIMH